MNGENFSDYLLVGGIVALCAFLLVRFIKQKFTGGASSGCCSCCSDGEDCTKI